MSICNLSPFCDGLFVIMGEGVCGVVGLLGMSDFAGCGIPSPEKKNIIKIFAPPP